MKYKLTFICFIILASSCITKDNGFIEVVKLSPEKTYNQIDNDLFLFEVRDIKISSHSNGDIFLINQKRAVKVDSSFKSYIEIGKYGDGPMEMLSPSNLFVKEDGIYITDSELLKIFKYNTNGEFLREWKLPDRYFTISDFVATLPAHDSEELMFYFNSPTKGIINVFNAKETLEFQQSVEIPSPTFISEDFYYLVHDGQNNFAIPHSKEVIYIYDGKGRLIDQVKLPDYLFADRLKFKEEQIKRNPNSVNSTFKLISDVYYNQGNLYLLLSQNSGENLDYYCNKVLVLDIKGGNKFKKVYQLKGDVFNQITIKDSVLFTYNEITSTIQKYILP
ncbi:hypothetical protein ACFSKL_09485 [Belliella marina]|uniref:6-bladed beta-propeller n=1 Tax=Belliella marina TaxID=1644146 RepID=A0ABW4VP17_9BACT